MSEEMDSEVYPSEDGKLNMGNAANQPQKTKRLEFISFTNWFLAHFVDWFWVSVEYFVSLLLGWNIIPVVFYH